MTDEELLAEVKHSWEHWAPHLGLENWTPKFELKKMIRTSLEIYVQAGYARVLIRISPKNDLGEALPVSWSVLHEMLHIFMAPMRQYASWHSTMTSSKESDFTVGYHEPEERAVDELAMIIWRLHEQILGEGHLG